MKYYPATCSPSLRAWVYDPYNYCCALCRCPDIDNLSVDRADSNKGYTRANSQCLCKTCNCTIKIDITAPKYPPQQPVLDINYWLGARQLYRWILGRKLKDPNPYLDIAA